MTFPNAKHNLSPSRTLHTLILYLCRNSYPERLLRPLSSVHLGESLYLIDLKDRIREHFLTNVLQLRFSFLLILSADGDGKVFSNRHRRLRFHSRSFQYRFNCRALRISDPFLQCDNYVRFVSHRRSPYKGADVLKIFQLSLAYRAKIFE